jgi:hypothetical protein
VADRRKRFQGDPRRRDRPKERHRSRAQRVRFWLGWWAFSLGLWMLLVFKTEPAEIALGAIAAAFAATAVALVRSRGQSTFAPEAHWLLGLWRLPPAVLYDCALLTRALWRRVAHGEAIEGHFRIVHFDGCAGDDPQTQARRATAKWLGGVGPNNYVVGFEEKHDAVLVRQLVRTDRVPDVDPERRR